MPLSMSTPIYSDDVIETDTESRVGLQLGDGSSIRIDRGSRIRFLTPVALEIIAGAAYVATPIARKGSKSGRRWEIFATSVRSSRFV